MIEIIKVGKKYSEGLLITEMDVRFDAIDKMFDRVYGPGKEGGKIKKGKAKKATRKEKIRQAALEMFDWEAEEVCGDESVDSNECFDYSKFQCITFELRVLLVVAYCGLM